MLAAFSALVLNVTLLLLTSAAVGFAVGAWYAYVDARSAAWSNRVEPLKPTGRFRFMLWKVILGVVILPMTILPFAAALMIPFKIAEVLAASAAEAIGGSILSLAAVALGNRMVRHALAVAPQ